MCVLRVVSLTSPRGGDENLSPGKTAPGVEEGRITASVGSLVLCVMDHDSEHRHV